MKSGFFEQDSTTKVIQKSCILSKGQHAPLLYTSAGSRSALPIFKELQEEHQPPSHSSSGEADAPAELLL